MKNTVNATTLTPRVESNPKNENEDIAPHVTSTKRSGLQRTWLIVQFLLVFGVFCILIPVKPVDWRVIFSSMGSLSSISSAGSSSSTGSIASPGHHRILRTEHNKGKTGWNDLPYPDLAHPRTDYISMPFRDSELPKRRPWNLEKAEKEGYKKTTGGLNDADRDIIGEFYSHNASVFEWGTGESSKIAQYVGVQRYTGVDSDQKWLEYVADGAPAYYRFVLADIGKLIKWGNPGDTKAAPKFPYYSQIVNMENRPFDFYMVDGRFRIACVCSALLHASRFNVDRNDFFVGLHDFRWRHKLDYVKAKQLLDFVEGFDHSHDNEKDDILPKIFVGRRKENITDEFIEATLGEFLYTFGR
jgi:hypothetical protein